MADRLLKVWVFAAGEVVTEDMSCWILMFAMCQKPGLLIRRSLRRQAFSCLASSSMASAAKTIDTASTGNL
jgi:hypothetical protein